MYCPNTASFVAPVNFRNAIWFTSISQFPLAWHKLHPVFLFAAPIISINIKLSWASHFLQLKDNTLHTKCSSLGSLCHAQYDITVSSGEVRTESDIMTHINTGLLTENKPITTYSLADIIWAILYNIKITVNPAIQCTEHRTQRSWPKFKLYLIICILWLHKFRELLSKSCLQVEILMQHISNTKQHLPYNSSLYLQSKSTKDNEESHIMKMCLDWKHQISMSDNYWSQRQKANETQEQSILCLCMTCPHQPWSTINILVHVFSWCAHVICIMLSEHALWQYFGAHYTPKWSTPFSFVLLVTTVLLLFTL
jgi:hypothetical protein